MPTISTDDQENKLSLREELRKSMVKTNIDELKEFTAKCNPLALRNVHLLGRINLTSKEHEWIDNLVRNFISDCNCMKKS